ncbi:SufS family cysteine desulfurase [Flaviflexus equikiangi]|uniref:Cysteine desulfurase n=1 Tax=Flaviflexus equikiangi TaxID=2758573 RepID=A0ABS2TFB5_9ACTO|nr:SufS family cysteine desulfurase [Flaviflexus equikiangi]MBM9433350.1 SufS family cysteine desulfurase [Flaviflexus equikiangi]
MKDNAHTPVPVTDFPILARQGREGHRLVYLDSAATSQRPVQVLDAERQFLVSSNGAVKRGSHMLAEEATEAYENARETVAEFIGAQANDVVWTKNSTEALNLVAYSLGNASDGPYAIGPGDEIVVTRAEHHSNLVPWQQLCARTGARLRWLDVVPMGGDDQGRIDLATLDVINAKTKVVAFAHVSNVTGAIAPVDEIVAAARSVGALVVLDACQSVPHLPVSMTDLGVDLAVFSGHKMLGPTGIGALWGRSEVLDGLPPFLTGGSMVEVVTMEETTFLKAPAKFEAGTPMVSQAIGLAAAADYLTKAGMVEIHRHEVELTDHLLTGIANIPGVRVVGPTSRENRLGSVAFVVEDVHPHDVGQVLDSRGVEIRVGHHCAQPIHQVFDTFASSRASIGPYNTGADIDAFLDALSGVRSYFGVS